MNDCEWQYVSGCGVGGTIYRPCNLYKFGTLQDSGLNPKKMLRLL